jgi:hypothetical protein
LRVRIVCRDHESNKILPRKARALADATGWALDSGPDPQADLNVFLGYIEYGERFSDWRKTPTAAYFTHHEIGTPYKEMWWELAAQRAGLRVVSSSKYYQELEPYGPTARARPPVDVELFTPSEPHQQPARPVVGLSGYVDGQQRKGANLALRLAGDERFHLVATGRGWPVRVQHERPYTDLPDFYRGLDVYLCTATIEGVPMPPLEALACGVPIVIPRDVGMMDDLGECAGIFRYDTGNYASMVEALEQACFGGGAVDREALRALIVRRYTPTTWGQDWQQAAEDFLHNAPPPVLEVDRHGQRGLYVVAYGDASRKCAKGALSTFKKYHPDIPMALVSDTALGVEDILIQEPDDKDIGGRHQKTKIYDWAPREWQYVLYLDADTETVAPFAYFLYTVLQDGWDMVICKNPVKYHVASRMIRPDNKDECEHTFNQLGTDQLIQLNGGVFAFQRNPRVQAFFTAWHAEWQRWGKRDQAALLRALFQHPLRLYVLTNHWNYITRYNDPPREEACGLLHYPMTARRWRGIIQGRSDSEEAWGAVQRFQRTGR